MANEEQCQGVTQEEGRMDNATNHPALPHGAMRGNGRFMDAIRVFQVLLQKHPSGSSVPNGSKENVYFLLNNEQNILRRGKGKSCRYADDCGAWSVNASCKSHHYVIRGDQLDNVDFKDGQYCKELKGCKVPLDPQPSEKELITFKRYYVSLKRNHAYRKRISTIAKCPASLAHLKSLAVIEYIGAHPSDTEPTEDPLSLASKNDSSDKVGIKNCGSLVFPDAKSAATSKDNVLESNGRFLDASNVFQVMLTKQPIGQDIPAGIKENVYFLLDNGQNVTRRASGKRSRYADDCGLWSVNGKSKYLRYIIRDGQFLDPVEFKGDLYYKMIKGERVLMTPQPADDHIIAYRQYYINLKEDPRYRKRVSLVTKCPDVFSHLKSLVVVEYIGKFPTVSSAEFKNGQMPWNPQRREDEEFLVCSPDIQSFNMDAPPRPEGSIPILHEGRFHDADSVFNMLLIRHPVGDTVPPGVKENVCYIIDNGENITRKANGKRCRYSDDCGTWSVKPSNDTDYYMIRADGHLAFISLIDGLYYTGMKGQRVCIDPQPNDENVVLFSRYRASLKGDPECRKRISTVLKCPDALAHLKNLAFVEYIRILPRVSKSRTNGTQCQQSDSQGENVVCVPDTLTHDQLKPISSEHVVRNHGKFLDGNGIYHVLLHGHAISDDVLMGLKENLYFLYKVEQSLVSETPVKKCPYADNCGQWIARPSCKTHHYIVAEGEQLDYVDMKDGVYCKDNKGARIPLEPQPDVEEIITFKRYYGYLKRNPNYKRRISMVVKCSDVLSHLKDLAVVEYIGSFYC